MGGAASNRCSYPEVYFGGASRTSFCPTQTLTSAFPRPSASRKAGLGNGPVDRYPLEHFVPKAFRFAPKPLEQNVRPASLPDNRPASCPLSGKLAGQLGHYVKDSRELKKINKVVGTGRKRRSIFYCGSDFKCRRIIQNTIFD